MIVASRWRQKYFPCVSRIFRQHCTAHFSTPCPLIPLVVSEMSELLAKIVQGYKALPTLQLVGSVVALVVSAVFIARAGAIVSDALRDAVQGPRAKLRISKVYQCPINIWSLG
jgi:hypothetical protein